MLYETVGLMVCVDVKSVLLCLEAWDAFGAGKYYVLCLLKSFVLLSQTISAFHICCTPLF